MSFYSGGTSTGVNIKHDEWFFLAIKFASVAEFYSYKTQICTLNLLGGSFQPVYIAPVLGSFKVRMKELMVYQPSILNNGRYTNLNEPGRMIQRGNINIF